MWVGCGADYTLLGRALRSHPSTRACSSRHPVSYGVAFLEPGRRKASVLMAVETAN